uniref:HAT C-terminal dimerisation domain-containing protein n=1 Tax=Glossina pallidipes TaxID=7398 RepID=A0A1A9ZA18_GLOPL
MFPKRAWHWNVNTIMDCFLRFLKFDWLTLFCNPFKCEEFEANISSFETSGDGGKGKVGKTKNAKRSIPRTIEKDAKRRKCQRKSADNKNSFNGGYNDAYDFGESDFEGCEFDKNNEQEDEEIVRNNTYGPNNNSVYAESIIIENDVHDNGDDPNIRNTLFSKLHRSTADAELFLLNPSDSINQGIIMFCDSFRSIALKCGKMSKTEKLKTEEKAKKLFNKMRGRRGKYKNIEWENLKLRQQVPFFWAALSDNHISCDPIENFKHFYVTTMTESSSMPIKKLKEHSLVVWHDMNAKERLPFIMQAFIATIASGEANANDCDELQTFIERVESLKKRLSLTEISMLCSANFIDNLDDANEKDS